MNSFSLNIAGFTIRIILDKHSLLQESTNEMLEFTFESDVLYLFHRFIEGNPLKKPDHTIIVQNKASYDLIKRHSDNYKFIFYSWSRNSTTTVCPFTLSIWQFQYLIAEIVYSLLEKKGGLELHCSSVEFNRELYVFLGKSGAGKSTISQLLGNSSRIVSDDKLYVRQIDGVPHGFQLPQVEKNYKIGKTRFSYPIKGFYFLKKSKIPALSSIEKLKTRIELLSQQARNETSNQKIIREITEIAKRDKSFFALSFPKNARMITNFFLQEIAEVS